MKKKETSISSKIIWAFVYLGIAIAVCIAGALAFHKFYYTFFYVSGPSMEPTLNNRPGYYDFGIVDSHKSVFNYLKRNDIVITYYPSDYNMNTYRIDELENGTYLLGYQNEDDVYYFGKTISNGKATSTQNIDEALKMHLVQHGNDWSILTDYGYLSFKENKSGNYDLVFSQVESSFSYDKKTNLLYAPILVSGMVKKYYIGFDANLNFIATNKIDNMIYHPTYIFDFDYKLKSGVDSKIKRVIGLPNETIQISHREISSIIDGQEIIILKNYITITDIDNNMFEYITPFEPIDPYGLSKYEGIWTLGPDEYFVMGDNWGHSTDSTSPSVGPIDLKMMTGILIAVEGYCQIVNNQPTNLTYTQPRFFKQ